MTKQQDILLTAISRGYEITKEGNVFRKGNKIVGSVPNSTYRKFNIKNSNKEDHPVYFHRLQAYQKFGDKIFEEGIVVRHLDGNSLNNSWDNIAIGSASQNQMDRSPGCRKNTATIASRKMQDSIRSYEERCLIYEDLKKWYIIL